MRIGVPKEIKEHGYRVGLIPESVREFAAAGHELSVETGAGAGINATDEAYLAAGATIVDTAAEIFAKFEMIIRVKEPQESEWTKLRENQIVFAFLHLAGGGLGAIADNPGLRGGLIVHRGHVTHPAIAASLGLRSSARSGPRGLTRGAG